MYHRNILIYPVIHKGASKEYIGCAFGVLKESNGHIVGYLGVSLEYIRYITECTVGRYIERILGMHWVYEYIVCIIEIHSLYHRNTLGVS